MIFLLSLAFAVDRSAALDQAAAYALHSWTSTAANVYASCSNDYQSDYSPGTHMGVPYDWGGYVTLSEFDSQIASGYGAGSHSWHGILSCTTGVDCSGFVSQVWGSGHYTTSTFDQVTHPIDWSELKPADAVNDPGSHIVLYTYTTDAGTPVFYEAAGSASQVRVNSSSGWSYLDGYQPVRFDSITDGSFNGTPGTAIEISAFPYADQRWTAGAASDVIDVYSCKTSADESGPEMLYHFYTSTGGTVAATVSDDEGVDIDIHVLTAPDGDACLGRDDTTVQVKVPPGEVYLSLDTYVSSHEYPGPYLLNVTFDGKVGEPEDTGPSDDTATEDTATGDTPDDPAVDSPDRSKGPHLLGTPVPLNDLRACSNAPLVSPLALLVGVLFLRRRKR